MELFEILLWICVCICMPFMILFIASACVISGRESRREESEEHTSGRN